MKTYYKDYRIKVVKNDAGTYDMYDNKYGGRKTWCNGTKEQIDEKIENILSKRNKVKEITKMKREKVTLKDMYDEIGKYLEEKGDKEILSISTHCGARDNTLYSLNLMELDADNLTETDSIRIRRK